MSQALINGCMGVRRSGVLLSEQETNDDSLELRGCSRERGAPEWRFLQSPPKVMIGIPFGMPLVEFLREPEYTTMMELCKRTIAFYVISVYTSAGYKWLFSVVFR